MSVREYVGARYVPLFADPIQWDKTKTYEPLTIVSNEGNSYTSRQFVPSGIEITNDDYWALTGNYNAQIEQYRQEVQQIAQDIPQIENDIESIEQVNTQQDERLDQIESSIEGGLVSAEYLGAKVKGEFMLEGGELDFSLTEPTSFDGGSVSVNGKTVDDILAANMFGNYDLSQNAFPTFNGAATTPKDSTVQRVVEDGINCISFTSNGASSYISVPAYSFDETHSYLRCAVVKTSDFASGWHGWQSAKNEYWPSANFGWRLMLAMETGSSYSGVQYIGNMTPSGMTDPTYMKTFATCFVMVDLTTLYNGIIPSNDELYEALSNYFRQKFGKLNATMRIKAYPSIGIDADEAIANFCDAANLYAKNIGMVNTSIVTPSGYPPSTTLNNSMTPYDAMRLGMAAYLDPVVGRITSSYNEYAAWYGASGYQQNLVNAILQQARTITQANVCLGGKGGSLQTPYSGGLSHGVKNYVGYHLVYDSTDKQYTGAVIVALMGMMYDEENVPLMASQAAALVRNKQENPDEEPTPTNELQTALTREDQPIKMAACWLPNGTSFPICSLNKDRFDAGIISVLYGEETAIVPASVTKLLTALTLQKYLAMDDIVTVKESDIIPGSGGILHAGDRVTVEKLMESMLMISDNQAATALARTAGERMAATGFDGLDF